MGTTNILDLNNRVGALKKTITENAEDTHDIEKDIYAVMGQMGAKNLIPYPYYWEDGYTYRGITFTYDSDGVIKANGTVSGTVSGFRINGETYADGLVLKAGNYILSGCPIGGASSKYRLVIRKVDSNNIVTTVVTDIGSGISFTISQEDAISYRYLLYCDILSGQTVSNLTFKPMLRLASDTDDTYQPYAKTNKELTDEVLTKIPDAPTTDGIYNLSVTVDNGTSVYSWVSTS